MFKKIYDALSDYESKITEANKVFKAENARIDSEYLGSTKAAAQQKASAAFNNSISSARKTARAAIDNSLTEIKGKIKEVAEKPIMAGTADAVAFAKLEGITAAEKEVLYNTYGKNYLSARLLACSLGDKKNCISLEEITEDLKETEQILYSCTSSSNPAADYNFLNVVSGNRLSGVVEEVNNFTSENFFESSED